VGRISNILRIERRVSGMKIVVMAERSERVEAWFVTCRVDGALFDQRQSDDAWATSQQMIMAAVIENEEHEDVEVVGPPAGKEVFRALLPALAAFAVCVSLTVLEMARSMPAWHLPIS
jgi:preprotein translocase subunit SecF